MSALLNIFNSVSKKKNRMTFFKDMLSNLKSWIAVAILSTNNLEEIIPYDLKFYPRAMVIDHKEMAVFLVFSLNKKKKYRAMELAWLQKSLLYVYIHQYIYLHLTELVTENWT